MNKPGVWYHPEHDIIAVMVGYLRHGRLIEFGLGVGFPKMQKLLYDTGWIFIGDL